MLNGEARDLTHCFEGPAFPSQILLFCPVLCFSLEETQKAFFHLIKKWFLHMLGAITAVVMHFAQLIFEYLTNNSIKQKSHCPVI